MKTNEFIGMLETHRASLCKSRNALRKLMGSEFSEKAESLYVSAINSAGGMITQIYKEHGSKQKVAKYKGGKEMISAPMSFRFRQSVHTKVSQAHSVVINISMAAARMTAEDTAHKYSSLINHDNSKLNLSPAFKKHRTEYVKALEELEKLLGVEVKEFHDDYVAEGMKAIGADAPEEESEGSDESSDENSTPEESGDTPE